MNGTSFRMDPPLALGARIQCMLNCMLHVEMKGLQWLADAVMMIDCYWCGVMWTTLLALWFFFFHSVGWIAVNSVVEIIFQLLCGYKLVWSPLYRCFVSVASFSKFYFIIMTVSSHPSYEKYLSAKNYLQKQHLLFERHQRWRTILWQKSRIKILSANCLQIMQCLLDTRNQIKW